MKIWNMAAQGFMSFSQLDLRINPGATVVTGPNAVGKSNLGRILDVARQVVASHAGSAPDGRLDVYERAPRHGARRFRLTLDIELDQPWEKELVATFVRAAYAMGAIGLPLFANRSPLPPDARDADARRRLDPDSVDLLHRGSLTIDYDEGAQVRWSASWRHSTTGDPADPTGDVWNLDLSGRIAARVGRASTPARTVGLAQAWRSVVPDDHVAVQGADPEPLDFMEILTAVEEPIRLSVDMTRVGQSLLDSVRDLFTLLEWNREVMQGRQIGFVHVLDTVLRRAVVLTDNRRLPLARSFRLEDLGREADLEDGSRIPGELYRLKNGALPLRQRYTRIQERFKELVGTEFDVQAIPDPQHEGHLLIDVTVSEGEHEYPLAFSGAGRQEALFLSTLLVGASGRVVVLDEPGVHIEPTLQRRLAHIADDTTQCLVITHSADLVPVTVPGDLDRIVRLGPSPEGSRAHRIGRLDPRDQARWLQVLGPRDVRALLFCAGAVLCEGATEVSCLGAWWENSVNPPSGANIALIDVAGDKAFGRYIEFLEAFDIPWAVIADGPALHPTSDLYQQMKKNGSFLAAGAEPDSARPDFDEWKAFWQAQGVFSVADVFGNDGSASGEFEAYLRRLDPQVMDEVKGRSKPRVGAAFAARCPMPEGMADLYALIRKRLRPTR